MLFLFKKRVNNIKSSMHCLLNDKKKESAQKVLSDSDSLRTWCMKKLSVIERVVHNMLIKFLKRYYT